MYAQDEWQTAFEATQLLDWDEIDAREQAGELARFLADVYGGEKVARDEFLLQAVTDAAAQQFDKWSTAEFMEVLNSYIGQATGEVRRANPAHIHIFSEIDGTTYKFNRIRA